MSMTPHLNGLNEKKFRTIISNLIGSHHKIETAKKFGVHAFFEDKHDNAVEIHEELDIPVILFDTPYNRKPIPEGVIRVYDWQEANNWIKRLISNRRTLLKDNKNGVQL